jgi:choline dehydrogenase-like flavoprotein
MITRTTDVLIVGSGFGAAAPALRLAQAGLRVTVLEKGPATGPGDYQQTQDPRYVLRYLKGLSGGRLGLTYAEALGGGSGFYEMVSLRAPAAAFDLADRVGQPLWPAGLTRAGFDPWYELAEGMLRVQQIPEEDVPRTGRVFAALMQKLGYSCDRAPYAVRGCQDSGFCVTGCIYGAKQSLHLNYLPGAVEHGAEIVCEAEVVSIRELGAARHPVDHLKGAAARYAVRCRLGGPDGETVEYRAALVVLAGGTVGTAKLLLGSRSALPRLSEQVGANIAFNGGVKTAALLPDDMPDGDMLVGRSHPGMISYEFLQSHGLTIAAAKPLPLQLVASARLARVDEGHAQSWWGPDHVSLMQQYRHRMLVLFTLGFTPPVGRITLDGHDQPVLTIDTDPALEAHTEAAAQLLRSIYTRAGCSQLSCELVDHHGLPHHGHSFTSAHQVGACRMADTPARGVVDQWGEVFHYPGLYVSDGAAVPSSLAVNTSLTILANAERIAAGMLDRYGLSPT